jgi:hypothetical protein
VGLLTPPCKKLIVTQPHKKKDAAKFLQELYSHGVAAGKKISHITDIHFVFHQLVPSSFLLRPDYFKTLIISNFKKKSVL